MKDIAKAITLSLLVIFSGSCGTKAAKTIDVDLMLPSGFDPAAVGDVIYLVVEYAGDSTEKTNTLIVYKEGCATSNFAAGCGYTPEESAELKFNFTGSDPGKVLEPSNDVILYYCARSAAGEVMYWGESNRFRNDYSIDQTIVINVASRGDITTCLEGLP